MVCFMAEPSAASPAQGTPQASPIQAGISTTPGTPEATITGSTRISDDAIALDLMGLSEEPDIPTPGKRRLAPIPERISGVRQDARGSAPTPARSFAEMEAEDFARATQEPEVGIRPGKPRGKGGKFVNPTLAAERGLELPQTAKQKAARTDPLAAAEGSLLQEDPQAPEEGVEDTSESPWTPRKILGHEFKTQEELETRLKIAEGRARKHQQAEDIKVQALGIAHGWKNYADQQAEEIEVLREHVARLTANPNTNPNTVGRVKSSGDVADPGDLDSFMGKVNWNGLAKVAEEHGIQHAFHHLTKAIGARSDAQIAQIRSEYASQLEALKGELAGIKPVTERVAQTQREHEENLHNTQVASSLFTTVAGHTDPDGTAYLYPELIQGAHPQAPQESRAALVSIIDIWKSYPPAFQVTPGSVRSAVLEYRHTHPQTTKTPAPQADLGASGDPSPEVLGGNGTPKNAGFAPHPQHNSGMGSESSIIQGIQKSFLASGRAKSNGTAFAHRF